MLVARQKRNWLYGAALAVMVVIAVATVAQAGDKNLFNDKPTEEKCRNCHDNFLLFPMAKVSNPDRHHLLMGKRMAYPTVAPGGSVQGVYECLTCHSLSSDPTKTFVLKPFRNCLACHPVVTVTDSPGSQNVHHLTALYNAHNSCKLCHDVYRRLFPPPKT